MSLGGMFGYMGMGVIFIIVLVMGSQLIHAANPPKVGDVINCNNICDITNKHIVLDDLGMYDYYVTCSNGATYALYDYNDYNKFPDKGSVWVRGTSIRMRMGLTMESWLNIKYATSNVQNACVITGGDVSERKEEISCLDDANISDALKQSIKNTPLSEQTMCFINQTMGFPFG